MDCSPPGFSVHGISQTGTLEWVASSFQRHLPDPGIEAKSLASPALALYHCTTWEAWYVKKKLRKRLPVKLVLRMVIHSDVEF